MTNQDGWTIETLKEHFDVRMAEQNSQNVQRFEAQEKAVAAALAAAKEAVIKAEAAAEKRFEGVNEFRATLADQQRTLMPRQEAELAMDSMKEKIDILQKSQEKETSSSDGEKSGFKNAWGLLVGIIGVAIAIISFLIKLK